MDERDIHWWGNLLINCKAEIQPLLHLITTTIQGLHGYQEEWVGLGQGFHSRTGEGHGPEEVQEYTHFREVVQKRFQRFSDPGSSWSGSKYGRRLKQIIRGIQQGLNQGTNSLHQGPPTLDYGISKRGSEKNQGWKNNGGARNTTLAKDSGSATSQNINKNNNLEN